MLGLVRFCKGTGRSASRCQEGLLGCDGITSGVHQVLCQLAKSSHGPCCRLGHCGGKAADGVPNVGSVTADVQPNTNTAALQEAVQVFCAITLAYAQQPSFDQVDHVGRAVQLQDIRDFLAWLGEGLMIGSLHLSLELRDGGRHSETEGFC